MASPADLLKRQDEIARFIQSNLTEEVDYGVVPGTRDKPSLFKPGAERINSAFGVTAVHSIVEKEIDHDRENNYVDKYKKPGKSQGLYRYVVDCRLLLGDRLLASCLATCSTLESKYISRPRDCENTSLKMAQKRAYVGATLLAYGLSNRFTADVEDTHANDDGLQERETERQDSAHAPRVEREPDAKKAGGGYDDNVPAHQRYLQDALKKREVPEKFWEEISNAMRGKVFQELDAVLAAVKAAK